MKALRVAVAMLALAAAVGVVIAFANHSYDWDLDHEIYFGQRLLAGELIWTQGFHDKLPFTQIAFAVPALFDDSLLAFRLLSLATVLAGAAAIMRLLPGAIGLDAASTPARWWTLAFGGLLFIALSTLQISGLMSMNPVAGSLAVIAALAMLTSMGRDGSAGPWGYRVVTAGSFAGAAGISLRPYFLAPLAVPFLFAALRRVTRSRSPRALRLAQLWVFAIAVWGLALNLLPYLLAGEMQAFRDGLTALRHDIHDRSFLKSVAFALLQPRALITLLAWAMILALVVLQIGAIRRDRRLAAFMAMLATSAGAMIGILAAMHFWAHYVSFFTGPLALAASVTILAWTGHPGGATPEQFRRTGWVVQALAGATLIWSVVLMALDSGRPHDEATDLAAVRAYLDETGLGADDMVAPSSMYLHWTLQSPLGVLPHAANSQHICFGWWQGGPQVASFPLPRTEAEYCTLLVAQARPLVIEQVFASRAPDCDWRSCLLANGYTIEREEPVANGTVLRFYRLARGR